MRRYLLSLEELKGFARDFETFLHPARENYDFGAMIEQFLHVTLLNARHMISACLAPVPFSRSTWKKLGILVRPGSPFHHKPSPGDLLDFRRAVFVLHTNNIVCQPLGSWPRYWPWRLSPDETHVPRHPWRDRSAHAATSYAQLAVGVLSREEGDDRLRT